jgi:hypothetical protein
MSNPELDDLIAEVESRSSGTNLMQRLTDSVIVAAKLEEMSDDLIGHFVEEARASGASWADIGQAMGVTRQAAQKRFVGRKSRRGKRSSFFMTRFAQGARVLVQETEGVARAAGSDHIGTEHLIISMTEEPTSLASRAFTALGASVDHLREESRSAIGDTDGPSKGHLPFAPDMKKVLELSLREAIRSHHRHISDRHILLGMLRDQSSFGGRTLEANGITRNALETWLDDNEDVG